VSLTTSQFQGLTVPVFDFAVFGEPLFNSLLSIIHIGCHMSFVELCMVLTQFTDHIYCALSACGSITFCLIASSSPPRPTITHPSLNELNMAPKCKRRPAGRPRAAVKKCGANKHRSRAKANPRKDNSTVQIVDSLDLTSRDTTQVNINNLFDSAKRTPTDVGTCSSVPDEAASADDTGSVRVASSSSSASSTSDSGSSSSDAVPCMLLIFVYASSCMFV
jgi:hypothetical protein